MRVSEREREEADTSTIARRFLPSQKFKARTMNVIKSSVLTDENYTRLALIYDERERTGRRRENNRCVECVYVQSCERASIFSSTRDGERENARVALIISIAFSHEAKGFFSLPSLSPLLARSTQGKERYPIPCRRAREGTRIDSHIDIGLSFEIKSLGH